MFSLKSRQKKVLRKRLEGKSSSRQVALCLGLIAFKGKTYFDKHPLHVLAMALLGGLAFNQTKQLNGALINFNHISVFVNTLKKSALQNKKLKTRTKQSAVK